MSVNFIQEGRILPFAAPSGGVVSGQGFMVGGLFAVAQYTAAATLTVEGAVTGVWSLPKTATKTFTVGALVYWDATAGSVTSVRLAISASGRRPWRRRPAMRTQRCA